MGYNYAWLLSATYVDLRLTNAVFQVSVALVYLCSVQLFDEVISFDRSLGVLLSLLGSFMASGAVFSGTSRTSARSTLIGTFLALLAAVGYTAYQTLFRWSFGHLKSHVSFLAGFGAWVSLWHLLLGFPLVFLAHLCGIEHLQWPSSWSLWLGTGFSALVAAVVNALYLCIVMWGSPMLLPSTSALSVPLTVFLDMALHEAQPERAELLGQLLVLISVVLIMRLHGGSILPTKRTVMKAAELVSL
ncbi:unnamed protein product [Durusdinium trenchii]|uniref:EamA domain-containing protein n=1 Tax=Durusdinium trenchii TaxID=1381693 RepID=A0ABP0MH41_9DINO